MAFKGDLEALVLGVLQGTAMHGYEISRRIRQLSEAALSVGEGQLYPTLHKLERDGLVAAEWVPQEGKPARKVYHLTEAGATSLAKHQKNWQQFSGGVGRILGLGPENTR